jgi:hypothetical protein
MRRTLSQRQPGLPVILGPQGFDDSDVVLAKEVAAWVAVAVGNAETAARTSDDLTLLRTVITSRACIEQAKGILMERPKITEDEAFTILTHASRRTNTKLRDVAAELVLTARCPVVIDTRSSDIRSTSLSQISPCVSWSKRYRGNRSL